MKIWYRVTITFTMLLVIFALLITGFQLAVYGDSHYGFYKKEYEKYRVTDDLNMKIDNVMAVTEHMMAYLIGLERKKSCQLSQMWTVSIRISSMNRTGFTWQM